jgi:hypothetical protein
MIGMVQTHCDTPCDKGATRHTGDRMIAANRTTGEAYQRKQGQDLHCVYS